MLKLRYGLLLKLEDDGAALVGVGAELLAIALVSVVDVLTCEG